MRHGTAREQESPRQGRCPGFVFSSRRGFAAGPWRSIAYLGEFTFREIVEPQVTGANGDFDGTTTTVDDAPKLVNYGSSPGLCESVYDVPRRPTPAQYSSPSTDSVGSEPTC